MSKQKVHKNRVKLQKRTIKELEQALGIIYKALKAKLIEEKRNHYAKL